MNVAKFAKRLAVSIADWVKEALAGDPTQRPVLVSRKRSKADDDGPDRDLPGRLSGKPVHPESEPSSEK